jgi:Holliday junction DNA helicase RuvA
MIGYLAGVLREKTPSRVVVDVAGVGYEVFIPLSTFTELPDDGKTVALRVYTHVRDDAIVLYGFHSARERSAFELLIRTSGIGPKLALNILSGMEPHRLLGAVATGDIEALRRVPGVGLKTAERIVVELRERAAKLALESGGGAGERRARTSPEAAADPASELQEQALSALLNLGYTRSQAERVVEEAASELGADLALESLLRCALRKLSR